jgi:uncharacterized protein (TIGR03435 family)
VLLLPDGIHDRLTSAQLQAVIAHELCHVRYRDNLVAAFHMFVETAFWFYPLVWWIGKRMVEERERACDEDVLRRGSEPRAYAEGILNVCKLYVESPVACVSGITGPDLRRRVERIMRPGEIRRLSPGHGLLLSVAAIGAIAIPVGIGMAGAPAVRAQAKQEPPIAFEVASVKGSDAADRRMYVDPPGGGRLTARNVALGWLVQFAYKIEWNQISGGPGWLNTARFDIAARAEDATASEDRIRLMARTLLSDRFGLRLHAESRELPVYLLVQAKAGTKEPRSLHAAGPCPERGPGAGPECQVFNLSPGGHLSAQRATMGQLARVLTDLTFRPVRDQTGIQGEYDFQLSWSPDDATPGAGNSGSAAPDLSQGSIFTALEEQLGLKLQSEKGPVDVFVIDHAEKPSEN